MRFGYGKLVLFSLLIIVIVSLPPFRSRAGKILSNPGDLKAAKVAHLNLVKIMILMALTHSLGVGVVPVAIMHPWLLFVWSMIETGQCF